MSENRLQNYQEIIHRLSYGSSQYRNNVFCHYFADLVRLLSLCNALLETRYTDPAELKITTLEGIFFDKQKNDISCVLGDQFLMLAEHQSSINENMPFRCLAYVAEILSKLVTDKTALYKKKLIHFPTPRFFVLYNGDEAEPLKREMRLSDSFSGDGSSLELMVTAYNINYGIGQPLLKKCPYLEEYSILVYTVKQNLAAGMKLDDAIQKAIMYCLQHNIMSDYLTDNKEVFNMMRLEWNIADAQKAWLEEGRKEGFEDAENKYSQLLTRLIADGRTDEVSKVAANKMRRHELYLQYGIN